MKITTLPYELMEIAINDRQLMPLIERYIKQSPQLDLLNDIIWNIITDYDDAWNVQGRSEDDNWKKPYSEALYKKLNDYVKL